LIAGASGVGKTTLGKAVAQELDFDRTASTDMIREVLRSTTTPGDSPALHRSTYSTGETGDAVTDWLDACGAVEGGLEAVVSRARREGINLVVEGAHVIPANRLLHEWRTQGGVAVGVALVVDDHSIHQERIVERESKSHRGSARYIAAFDRIREIQSGLITRAKGSSWKLLDTHLHKDGVERLRQWFNEAWYQQR
jgi:2-phosphoglycerate kinase